MDTIDYVIQVLKFAAIIVGSASGLVGTIFKTRDDDTKELTAQGKWIVGLLIASGVVAFSSQAFESFQTAQDRKVQHAKDLAQETQLDTDEKYLVELTNDAKTMTGKAASAAANSQQATAESTKAAGKAATASTDALLAANVSGSAEKLVRKNLSLTQVALEAAKESKRHLLMQSAILDASVKKEQAALDALKAVSAGQSKTFADTWKLSRPFGTWFCYYDIDIDLTRPENADLVSELRELGYPIKIQSDLSPEKLFVRSCILLLAFSRPRLDKSPSEAKDDEFVLRVNPSKCLGSVTYADADHTKPLSVKFYVSESTVKITRSSGRIASWVDLYGAQLTIENLFKHIDPLHTAPRQYMTFHTMELGYFDTILPKTMHFDQRDNQVQGANELNGTPLYQSPLGDSILGKFPPDFPNPITPKSARDLVRRKLLG